MERERDKYNPLLKEIWSEVRKKHFFPELPDPVISESMDRVALELKSKLVVLTRLDLAILNLTLEDLEGCR